MNKEYKVPLIRDAFRNEKEIRKKLADFILNVDRFSMGDKTIQWEKEFAKWHERKYSIFVNSGSSANLLMIQSLLNIGFLKKGDKVGFTCLTWSTNVMPLIQLGLRPIPIDIDPRTLNNSLKEIESVHSKHKDLKCIFLTNVLGMSDAIDLIAEYCQESKIILLEDNCESLGSKYKGKLLGNFSLASTVSTFLGHHLSTIEGGFVLTDNEELYLDLLAARSHGWSRSWPNRIKAEKREELNISTFHEPYTFFTIGMNLRPMEIQSFIGIDQLKYLNDSIDYRFNFIIKMQKILENSLIRTFFNESMNIISAFAVPLIFRNNLEKELGLNYFKSAGIEIRPIISGNIINQPFAKKYFEVESHLYPNSEMADKYGFYFTCRPDLNKEEEIII